MEGEGGVVAMAAHWAAWAVLSSLSLSLRDEGRGVAKVLGRLSSHGKEGRGPDRAELDRSIEMTTGRNYLMMPTSQSSAARYRWN